MPTVSPRDQEVGGHCLSRPGGPRSSLYKGANQRDPYLVIWPLASREGRSASFLGVSSETWTLSLARLCPRIFKGEVLQSHRPWLSGPPLCLFHCWLLACGLCHSCVLDRPGRWALESGPGQIRPWGSLVVQDFQMWFAKGCQAP